MRERQCFPVALLAVVLFLMVAAVSSPLFAQSFDQRDEWQRSQDYFSGLRSRGLFSLAEAVCLRRLADKTLNLVARTRFSVELSQSFTEHSRTVSTLDEQTELLKHARRAVTEVLESRQNHPQQLLLESQLAFVTASEVESLRWRFELSPFDRTLTERAFQISASLIPELQRLETAAGDLARARSTDVMGEKLEPHQLQKLQRAVRLRSGLVLLDQARLFPESSSDRADALVKADESLRRLAAVSSRDQVMWQSQLGLTETLRLRGNQAAAWSMLNAMRDDKPPDEFRDAMAVEQVELLIDENRYTDAADVLQKHQKEQRGLNGPLSFQSARVFLKLSQIAEEKDRPQLASELRQEVQRAIQMATATGNNYWATRAQNLLADEQSRDMYGAEVGALVREGQALYAAGKPEAGTER
ncbi:MAG: hypothetical protein O3B86_14180, partial [Planctomycetota bacterium]|nr:hypothetical protein [Planctomycetota bacterium]